MMKIRRILPQSLIDYPDKISCVIFLGGCNFKCRFCFVPELLRDDGGEITQDDAIKFLEGRKVFLDGVVISGGEPTINEDLPAFIAKIKSLGFFVRLYTNGSNPMMLKRLIERKLVDSVAIDIKARLDEKSYKRVAGMACADSVIDSICVVIASGLEREFRVVMTPERTEEDIREIEGIAGHIRRMEYKEAGYQ